MFDDLAAFVSAPRVTGLRLSPDGSWLAATVQKVTGEPGSYATSIWRVDAAPGGAPARLTRSADGESGPEFLPDGSLLFTSRRPDTEPGPAADAPPARRAALWMLPAAGGEARRIAAPPGGVSAVQAARRAAAYVCAADVLPGTAGAEQDASRRKARTDAGVQAILHESGLLRYWDHDLGPGSLRLLAGEAAAAAGGDSAEPRDLTPDAGRALDEQAFDLAPDGSVAVTGWRVPEAAGEFRTETVAITVATGDRRVLLTAPDADFENPSVSPDGRLVLAVRSERDTRDRPGDVTLVITALPAAGAAADSAADSGGASPADGAGNTAGAGHHGGPRDILDGWDRRPMETAWAPDSRSVYFTADDQGRRPVFRVAAAGGAVTRITADAAAYDNLSVSPDGQYLYALRNAIDAPPAPVRIDLAAGGSASPPVALASPVAALSPPGSLAEIETAAADGTIVRGWLALPPAASADTPAPLLLWVHGGPVSSWNTWSWRWNPWLLTARGYAVLLPDPALSTGYGQAMIARGHVTWGEKPYTDVMAMTDAAVARPDIDASRTAMMGGSFGGYMANWMAGHTDRFGAIVSHAGLWALDQMFATTDNPAYWRRTFGDPATEPDRYRASSPHLHVAEISTPMLVIHGDRDYRVPVGEALRLWADLASHGKAAKFLYFPDENHWILKPGDALVWYETVIAFLAQHVLGQPWQRPELL